MVTPVGCCCFECGISACAVRNILHNYVVLNDCMSAFNMSDRIGSVTKNQLKSQHDGANLLAVS